MTPAPGSWRLGHRPSLDALRGVAILLVLAGHFRVVPAIAATVGVTLFFALSGYLITGLLLGEWADRGRLDFRAFYWRRARRLLPALALLLAGTGLAATLRGELATWLPASIPVALYVGNYGYIAGIIPPELSHTWSLAIEEQFYLLWPAALVLLLVRGLPALRVGIVVLLAASFLATIAGLSDVGLAYNGSPARAKDLLAGAFVAVLSFSRGRDAAPPTAVFAVAALLVGWSSVTDQADVAGTVLLEIPCAVVVAWFAARPYACDWWPLTGSGRISYGLYLYHYPLIGLGPPLALAAGTYALAIASWVAVERRVIARRRPPVTHLPAGSWPISVEGAPAGTP